MSFVRLDTPRMNCPHCGDWIQAIHEDIDWTRIAPFRVSVQPCGHEVTNDELRALEQTSDGGTA